MSTRNFGRGDIDIRIEHLGDTLVFSHPPFNPASYSKMKECIEAEGLITPTFAQTMSLVHHAYTTDDATSWQLRKLIEHQFLYGFTGTLFTQEGVYVEDYPRLKDGLVYMEREDLLARLEANDPLVRFVPKGFAYGLMRPEELAKNPLVIGLGGEEAAAKAAETAALHLNPPCLWAEMFSDGMIGRTIICSDGHDDNALGIHTTSNYTNVCHFAYGIKK